MSTPSQNYLVLFYIEKTADAVRSDRENSPWMYVHRGLLECAMRVHTLFDNAVDGVDDVFLWCSYFPECADEIKAFAASRKGAAAMEGGLELLATWSRSIAMLPLEGWQRALEHAETVGPLLDPTLFREYLASPNPAVIKELLEAAIRLKAVVLKYQRPVANG